MCREGLGLAPERVESYFYLALNLGQLSELRQTSRFLKEMAQYAAPLFVRNPSPGGEDSRRRDLVRDLAAIGPPIHRRMCGE